MYGVLLAAGAGSRMGRPKSLVADEHGEAWVALGVRALRDGGCSKIAVVLGARADEAMRLVPRGVEVVVAPDWAAGLSASVRAGLTAATASDELAAMVHLVDIPDVTADVVGRVASAGDRAETLARAAYGGLPGHPVLVGRNHWDAVLSEAIGDTGARSYLAREGAVLIECGEFATGRDIDRPP